MGKALLVKPAVAPYSDSLQGECGIKNRLTDQRFIHFPDAAGHYSQAVLADPSFQQARVRYQAARSAPASSQNVVALASEPTQQPDDFGVDASRAALQGSIGDIASTYAEQNTEIGSESPIELTSREGTATTTSGPGPEAGIAALTAIIRIIFTIP